MAHTASQEHNGLKINAHVIEDTNVLEVRAFPNDMLTRLDARPSEALEYANRYIRVLAGNLGSYVVVQEATEAVHGSAVLTALGKTVQDFEAAHAKAVAAIGEPSEYPRGGPDTPGFRARLAPSAGVSRDGRA